MILSLSFFLASAILVPCDGGPNQTDPPEADREAILAMAGDYSVRFRFEESVSSLPGYQLKPIYEAAATESIRVIEDRGDFIRLQHILVLDSVDGGPPELVKHWRQDWTWQDTELLEFRGRGDFRARSVDSEHAHGQWSQAVFQVSDQPRYESLGHWTHESGVSIWRSGDTWRPLPRRETGRQDDYQVLATRNTHIVTSEGWVHQQESRKLVLDESGQVARVLAVENGLNRYRRCTADSSPVDFSAADRYWLATQEYWAQVRLAWAEALRGQSSVHIASSVEGRNLARALLSEADKLCDRPGGPARFDAAFFATTQQLIAGAVQAKQTPAELPNPSSW